MKTQSSKLTDFPLTINLALQAENFSIDTQIYLAIYDKALQGIKNGNYRDTLIDIIALCIAAIGKDKHKCLENLQ